MIINCGICYDTLKPDQKIQATQCGHIFHGDCVSFWLSKDGKCPTCRVVAKRRTLIPIYVVAYETSDSLLNKKVTLTREVESLKEKIKEQECNLKALQVKLETTNYNLLLALMTLVGLGIWGWFMVLGS